MNKRADCEQVRELAPEVALGLASGDDRALVLRHAAKCADCREIVRQTAAAADELLLVAPSHEPPPGFEGRVLERLEEEWSKSARPRRWPVAIAAAALAAILGVTGVLLATSQDRDVGEYYRALLERTDGDYFTASLLRDENGSELGIVWAYQGEPSWMFVVLRDDAGAGVYEVVAVTSEGERVRLGQADLQQRPTWGTELSIAVHDVEGFRLEGPQLLSATLGD